MTLLTATIPTAAPPGITTGDIWQTIVTILFALSLISERIANLLKLQTQPLEEMDTRVKAKVHERKVMGIALLCGEITAILAGADLFTLVQSGKLLPLSELFDFSGKALVIAQRFLGVLLTGVFISLGSKFWHDVLDIVLQFSQLKKFQAVQAQQNTNSGQQQQTLQKVANISSWLKTLPGYSGFEPDVNSQMVNLLFSQPVAQANLDSLDKYLGQGNYAIITSNIQTVLR